MLEVLKRRALLPLAIAAVPAYSSIVIAQQSPPNPTENRFKIPDCQLTFQLRTTALVVDTAWLEYGAMPEIVLPLRETHVCPTQPIEIDNLWLSSAVLGVLKINDLGRVPGDGVGGRWPARRSDRHESGAGGPISGHRGDPE